MLEARSQRIKRSGRSQKKRQTDADVIVTDDLSQLGIGRG